MVRVLIVDGLRLMCNVIAAVLEEESDIEVVGYATTFNEALAQIRHCDVVLISTDMPEYGAIRLTQAVTDSALAVNVLILGLAESEPEILQYIEAGAAGYVLKGDSTGELIKQIRAVNNGEALVSPEIAAALMGRVAELSQLFAEIESGIEDVEELTAREHEILELIGQGFTNREISERLYIEVGTVKNHVHNILQKLNVNSRHDAAAYLTLLSD